MNSRVQNKKDKIITMFDGFNFQKMEQTIVERIQTTWNEGYESGSSDL